MNLTFFTGGVVGHINNPAAILARGLAHGLALRGNNVRIVEPRRNAALEETLRVAGSGAARHFYDTFTLFQHHTYEPRSGPTLLEFLSREIALIDVAVAIEGLDLETMQWLANITGPRQQRAFLTFGDIEHTLARAEELLLDLFDIRLTTDVRCTEPGWIIVPRGIVGEDTEFALEAGISPEQIAVADPIRAAEAFEAAVRV